MKSRPVGQASQVVTDDAAEYAETAVNGGRRPIYDPSPLPEVPPGLTFSPAHKRRMQKLFTAPKD